jgi:hypothetical protein
MNSHCDGPLSFVVDLDGVEGTYGVHLHLSGMTWRLSGLDVQDSARLAREIAERVGGMIGAPQGMTPPVVSVTSGGHRARIRHPNCPLHGWSRPNAIPRHSAPAPNER